MNKFLSVLIAGLFAGNLSVGAFAADAAKPVVDGAKDQAKTAVAVKKIDATTKTEETSKTDVKKDTGIKASLKKLLPHAKDSVKK